MNLMSFESFLHFYNHFDTFRHFLTLLHVQISRNVSKKKRRLGASRKAFKIQYNTTQYPPPPHAPAAWGGVGGDIGDIVLYCIVS